MQGKIGRERAKESGMGCEELGVRIGVLKKEIMEGTA